MGFEVVHLVLGDVAGAFDVDDGNDLLQGKLGEDDAGRVEARLAGKPFDLRGEADDFQVIRIAVDEGPEGLVVAVVVA